MDQLGFFLSLNASHTYYGSKSVYWSSNSEGRVVEYPPAIYVVMTVTARYQEWIEETNHMRSS